MKLKRLLKEVPVQEVKGSKEIEITGVCANSKLVSPGNLFIAKRGLTFDGTQYIPEAIAAGAVAVLTDIYDPFQKEITQLIDPNVAGLEPSLAAAFYQHSSRELFTVGVTGTNGKTTTTYWIKHMLDALEGPCGLIGTIECIMGSHRYQSTHTTPEVTTLHKMFREMVLQQCQSAVMEVSSHALDQGRVANIEYDVAVFSNLTEEHLDYHKTMQEYCRAKNLLFRSLKPDATAVINKDDFWENKMSEGCQARIITYGIKKKADLVASDIVLTSAGTSFNLTYQGTTIPYQWSHPGRFNVYNFLATIAVGLARNEEFTRLTEIMRSAPSVPGRLEPVPNDLGIRIYVDYAHTDDSLAKVLDCLKELATKRIITVFGCGGDRDTAKRPRMARVAEELSDFCIVTTDNPRSEDPRKICDAISAGFQKGNHAIELDRRRAIALAIDIAKPEDIILIAGKGHETYQIFPHQTMHFDDREVAKELCQATIGMTS